jgi:hypothetical protein
MSEFTDAQLKELRNLFISVTVEQIRSNVQLAIEVNMRKQLQETIEQIVEKARSDVIREIVARLLKVSIEEWEK